MGTFEGKKRSELPDSVFGIPQERKYPMPDEKHTRSAIKLFNHVEPKYEEQLAKAIIKNMKKYNIDGSVVGPNNRLRKYLPKDMIKEYVEEACKDLTHARKLCNAVRKLSRKYNANYFFVTDGASSYSNGNGKYNTAAKEMRDHMDDWERNNGFNPDDDWTNDINNVSNYRLLKESSIPEEIPKDIRELLRRLNSYDYGYIKNGQKIKGTKNFFEDYKSLTISEFEKYQIGVCWDYVHYEAYWFAKNHYKYETFYIQVQDEDNDCPSHTYLVFYLPNSSKVYYFESSWGKYQGIEAFDNINKLHTTIKERHIESARSKCDPKTYFRNKYDAKSSRWEHLSCGDYMVKVSNGKVKINESVSSTVSKDHKQKGYIKLSSLKKIRITESIINKYKKEYPVLKHVRCKDTDEYICDGYMWLKDNALVCYVGSCKYNDDNTKWIVSLEVMREYRGYGLSNQILDFCVKFMNCKYLSVRKNNNLAKKIYDKYGFKVYYEDKNMYYMTLDTIPKTESCSLNERCTPKETGITTVIFDIGDVLVSSNFRDCLLQDPEIPNEIVDELISLWIVDKDDIDDTLTLDNYREIAIKRLGPDFSKYIQALIRYSVDCVLVFDYTVPLIQDLKDKGYKVYYLSNWSAWTHDLLLQVGKFDFLKMMDGGVFSYDVRCRKPDHEIYEIFLKKYNINPKESIFFDDKEDNIKTAIKLGINGIVFSNHDPSIVYNALSKNIIYSESSIANTSISEYGTTAGTIVGSNQTDSVYIVNYMQNNAFSGYKESKFGICKKGMKDLHVVGKHNKFHHIADLDKFKNDVSDIHVYRYKGKPKTEFCDIIENVVDDDIKLYEFITGKCINDRSMIKFDGNFIEEECFFDEIDAIKSCTEASLLEISTNLYVVPILTESVQGRQYNYYRDINGVFMQNEITKLRSKSYLSIDEIPSSEIALVKRGYLI